MNLFRFYVKIVEYNLIFQLLGFLFDLLASRLRLSQYVPFPKCKHLAYFSVKKIDRISMCALVSLNVP